MANATYVSNLIHIGLLVWIKVIEAEVADDR